MSIKVKVYNAGNNELPTESTPFSAAKDIRARIEAIDPKFLFNGFITSVSANTKTGFTSEIKSLIEQKDAVLALVLHPGGRVLIPSGLTMEIPEGYSMDVRARSGLALKYGLEVVNGPGLIDSDYRGDVGIILKNGGSEPIIIVNGERIAQVKLNKDVPFEWEPVDDKSKLSSTVRGDGGFNSTGTK